MQRRKLEALSDSVQDSHEECELGDADDDLLADAEDEQELGHSQPSPSPERVKNATFSPTLAPRRSRSPRKRNSGFSASPRLRGEVFADFVSSVYDDMIPNHCGDLAAKMNNFLRSGVMSEEGKLARVLKCIQQEIICPAVMSLRTDVYPKFPYKDLKGTWYVRVELFFETSESAQSTRMRSMPSISDSAGSGMVKRGRKRTRDQNKETGEPRVGRKERMRSIPEDWMQRTYSMPAFDPLPSRRKRSKSANKESTGPGRKSSLRESLRQTISMDDSDVEEEAVNPLSRMGSIIIPTQRGGKEELRRSVKELSHGTLKRVRVLHANGNVHQC